MCAGDATSFSMGRLIINCDLGENEAPTLTQALIGLVDAVNIACGVHAGSLERTEATLLQAHAAERLILVHPGLSVAGGRGAQVPSVAFFQSILVQQVLPFLATARRHQIPVWGLKLHGSLYHLVEQSPEHLAAYLEWVSQNCPALTLFARAGGFCVKSARQRGLLAMEEIFLDRAYSADGQLVPRSKFGAVLSLEQAWARYQGWLQTGQMLTQSGVSVSLSGQTVCVHGDSPDALLLLQQLRKHSLPSRERHY